MQPRENNQPTEISKKKRDKKWEKKKDNQTNREQRIYDVKYDMSRINDMIEYCAKINKREKSQRKLNKRIIKHKCESINKM